MYTKYILYAQAIYPRRMPYSIWVGRMDLKVKTLIKDLKNKNPEIRRNATKELGKLQVEDTIEPLTKMANGGFRKFLVKYNLKDQITAIEALAETGNQKALMFIERIKYGRTRATYLTPDKLNEISPLKEATIIFMAEDNDLFSKTLVLFPQDLFYKQNGFWIFKIKIK